MTPASSKITHWLALPPLGCHTYYCHIYHDTLATAFLSPKMGTRNEPEPSPRLRSRGSAERLPASWVVPKCDVSGVQQLDSKLPQALIHLLLE